MPNKKINALDARTAVSTDLMLVGDPSTGTAYKSTLATLPLVPTSRTLTINGVAFDLSANRAWTLGTVTSVGLTMPSAFGVANSPITSSGTLAVTALGSASQYIRGDGVLATLPTGGSGGSSVSYYLNGGTAASVGTYYQMSTTAVVGTNADFTRTGNGLISQFLTDVGDPNRLQIPAGNWNFEMFFSMSSSGGTPEFYVELLKYDGTTFTSIASSSAIPEVISGGTIIDLYLTSLAIPATTLLATDRLALRVYIVNNSGGRTATLHTQDSHLCQVITNFAGGISALNGLTANTQYFATGTSGTDFGISSASDTHTFNLPTASATNRGALSSADWTTFNNKVPTSRTLTINGTAYDLSADRSWTIPSANIYNSDGTLTSARILTANGFGLTFLGGLEEYANAQIGLRLQGSAINKSIYLNIKNTATTGKDYAFRSMTDGKFELMNYTDLGLIFSFDNVTSLFTFTPNITKTNSFYLGNSSTINGLWLQKTSFSATTYSIVSNATQTFINASGGGIYFRNNNTDQALLTAAGRLLLGTVSESTNILEVNGTARIATSLTVLATGLGSTQYSMNITGNSTFSGYIGAASGYIPILAISTSVIGSGSTVLAPGFNIQGGALWIRPGTVQSTPSLFAKDRFHFNQTVSVGYRFTTFNTSNDTESPPNQGVNSTLCTLMESNFGWITGVTGSNQNPIINNFKLIGDITLDPTNLKTIRYRAISIQPTWVQNTVNSTLTGIFYDPTLTQTPTIHNSIQTVTGDVLLGTTSGSVGIGANTTINASAIVDITSTSRGFLPPRMTTTQRDAIASPATGLIVYNTTLNSTDTYDGARWRTDAETITTNRQTASYSLVLADRGKLVEMNSASANTLTIPLNSSIAFPIGSKIDVTQYGAGATTITATSGVTIRSFTSFLKLAGQYAACTLVKIGTDEWYCYGNLIA